MLSNVREPYYVPAMTLKIAHSVGRSGLNICIGIQNGGFALELRKQYTASCQQIVKNL